MNKSVIQIIAFIAGCVALFFIGQNLISDHQVPSLGDFLASSTEEFASSTADFASSTMQFSTLASSTQNISAYTALTTDTLQTIDVTAPKGTIKVMIADTDASREQGLSNRLSLSAAAGMLFIFDTPGNYAFWMKGMHFPLDIVWVNVDKTVVGVTKDISPDTYPSTFPPPGPILYVLEINAGYADKFGLIPGATVSFDLPKSF